jgi:16S rRNA U1498 N3-methylase RsmE
LADAGVLPVGLGSNRLRTETAAMALLSATVLFSDASAHGQQQ